MGHAIKAVRDGERQDWNGATAPAGLSDSSRVIEEIGDPELF